MPLDPALVAGVKRFQLRHGLPETGIVGPATVKAMNVPVQDRLRQLVFSQQRLAASTFGFGQRHVIVNIPSAAVETVENGTIARRYVAVVGDPEHPSPTVEARIGAINFNPNWTVPTSIIRKEIIPKMRKDPTYLAKSRIRMLDAAGQEVDPTAIDWSGNAAVNYTLRQDPGAANSLGLVRIAMPNRESVYMHDTPSKRFFARDLRFLSHGCVRVSGVLDLVTWLLAPRGWTREAVDAAIATADAEGRPPAPARACCLGLPDWLRHAGRPRPFPRRRLWPRPAVPGRTGGDGHDRALAKLAGIVAVALALSARDA